MKHFFVKYEANMLRIIIIMIGYILNNSIIHENIIIDHGNFNNFEIKNQKFLKNYSFC